LGFRNHSPRAIAIATLAVVLAVADVAVIGFADPAALVASTPTQPLTIETAAFTKVVVASEPSSTSDQTVYASRVLSTELRDDTVASKVTKAALARVEARVRHSKVRAEAATSVVRHLPKPKPKPKPAATASSSSSSSSRVTFAGGSSAARNRVVQIALNQLNDRYVAGGTGPSSFDCSGLVRYAYNQAGVGGALGGGHSASAMLAWGRSMGLTSRTNGRVGDVVIYGNGSHAGIYIGNGRIVSALNPSQGIRVTGLYALGAPFTTFIHTRI
jgi:cell wall-associated NlpC family hydrolase